MLCIIAHHYVVNSGIIDEITPANVLSGNSLFALVFGWGGKTGINCFVLITGYFMCKAEISPGKLIRLVFEIEFYHIVFYILFLISGYAAFSWKGFIKMLIPVYSIGTGFVGSFLVFYLFIPFLNLLLGNMDKKRHRCLIALCLLTGSLIPTFLKASSAFTYIGWFMSLYFMAAYVRMYPEPVFDNRTLWGIAALVSLLLSWGSVLAGSFAFAKWGEELYYYFVSDSHKVMAVVTAACSFMYFKNLDVRYSPLVNRIAASTFGVLLIHANSDTMRRWLWKNMLNNTGAFYGKHFVAHALVSVICVYIVCTVIDIVVKAMVEKPIFRWIDRICSQSGLPMDE